MLGGFLPLKNKTNKKHQKISLDFTYLQLLLRFSPFSRIPWKSSLYSLPPFLFSTHPKQFFTPNTHPRSPGTSYFKHQYQSWPCLIYKNIWHSRPFWNTVVSWLPEYHTHLVLLFPDCSFSGLLADSSSSPHPLNVGDLNQFNGLTITDKLVIPNVYVY